MLKKEYLPSNSSRFPQSLLNIADCPRGLWIWGSQENISRFEELDRNLVVAIVGTRKVTEYGKTVTKEIVVGLCDYDVCVVSGMMYGVDEVAHRACVEAGGFTVGVWAGGLDTLLGGTREGVTKKILESGVVISEYGDGFMPQTWTFPARNRIVAGLSQAVVVTEAAANSGSLITAGFAAEFGREVMAVPGQVTSPLSQGVNYLLKNGARMALGVSDVLLAIGINPDKKSENSARNLEQILALVEDKVGKKIMEMIFYEGKDLDVLVLESGLSSGDLLATLSLLEVKGLVSNREGKYFANVSFAID